MLELNTGDVPYTSEESEKLTTKVKGDTGIVEEFILQIGEDGRTVTVTVNDQTFNGQTFD